MFRTVPVSIIRRFSFLILFCKLSAPVHRDEFLYQNQPDTLISEIYFWNKSLHVSDSSCVHHQEIFRPEPVLQAVSTPVRQVALVRAE
jgi:hypothetical protein